MLYKYPSIELLNPGEPQVEELGLQGVKKQNVGTIYLGGCRIRIDIEPLPPGGSYVKEPRLRGEMKRNSETIRQTLADFGIEVEPGPITRGPTVTRYEFIRPREVRLSRFAELRENIAEALKVPDVNVLAPIPGKNSVGIEVPNKERACVALREVLESPEWCDSKARMPIVLGKDMDNKPVVTDLAKAPHLLIAGCTGSGKSVCINTIIASLLYKFSPKELLFIMVDTKRVELQQYNGLPHMPVPVITEPKKAVLALQWLVTEIERRYKLFTKAGVHNIEGVNNRVTKPQPSFLRARAIGIPNRLEYIVLVIDDLSDLMCTAAREVEVQIMCITQLARAAGIHCIITTQRPSEDVLTGVIKENIPARIAFKVSNRADSVTILDRIGAEKLLGEGDMLYHPPGAPQKRIQGAFVSDEEINSLLAHIKAQRRLNLSEDLKRSLER